LKKHGSVETKIQKPIRLKVRPSLVSVKTIPRLKIKDLKSVKQLTTVNTHSPVNHL